MFFMAVPPGYSSYHSVLSRQVAFGSTPSLRDRCSRKPVTKLASTNVDDAQNDLGTVEDMDLDANAAHKGAL